MLLAVGGSFFSSSATGYSKGLALLLLWQRDRKKPMKVTPCNQYQLVDQESDPDILLVPTNNWLIWGCNSLVCCDCTANRKKGSTHGDGDHVLTPCLNFEDGKDIVVDSDGGKEDVCCFDGNAAAASPKSILKKSVKSGGPVVALLPETDPELALPMEKRKVMWPDSIGRELFEIREFAMSEAVSEDELDHMSGDTCSGRCIIM